MPTSMLCLELMNYTTISRHDCHQASPKLLDTGTAEPKCPCNMHMSTPSITCKPNLSTEDEPLILYPVNSSAVELASTLLGTEQILMSTIAGTKRKLKSPSLWLSRDSSINQTRSLLTATLPVNARTATSPGVRMETLPAAERLNLLPFTNTALIQRIRVAISSDRAQALDNPTTDGYATMPKHSSAHKSQANEEDERSVPQFEPSKPIKSSKLFTESSTSNPALDLAVKALTKPTISSAELKSERSPEG